MRAYSLRVLNSLLCFVLGALAMGSGYYGGTAIAQTATNVTQVGSTTVDVGNGAAGGGTQRVSIADNSTGQIAAVGKAAHDAAVSGAPVLQGLEARTTDGTAVASGDAVRAVADTLGKQVSLEGSIHALRSSGTTTYTTATAADVIAAAGAGIKLVPTCIVVTNAHSTQGTKVEIRDGTAVKLQAYAAPAGGGFSLCNGSPVFVGTANTALTARAVTSGADVDVTIAGYRIAN